MTCNTAGKLIEQLQRYGVKHIFGIPGVHTLELYRALAASNIRHITPRHEQGAGFMADGYARASGEPGVCFVISGPGMTNIITAMAQAWSESIPMLVISTVNAHGKMSSGNGNLHELANQQALIDGVSAFSHTLHAPSELEQVLARAFSVFDSARPRPVHIEIPINVLSEFHSEKARAINDAQFMLTRSLPACASEQMVQKAATELCSASKPLILAGGGSIQATQVLQALAERLNAPVVMTVNARGVLNATHPLGVSASASLQPVRDLIDQADVVLGVGTEMGPTDYDFNEDGLFCIPGIFIRIDIDAQQMQRGVTPQISLLGDSQLTCSALYQAIAAMASLRPSQHTQKIETNNGQERAAFASKQNIDTLNKREQGYLQTLDCIRESLNDPIIVGDSTQLTYTGNSAFAMNTPGSWFNSAMGFGTLGYALPAAIGAVLATAQSVDVDSNITTPGEQQKHTESKRIKRDVVAISGDGGLQFCIAELASAIDAQVSLILIVHENGGYREINTYMQNQSIKPIGVELMTPDFSAVATAFSWKPIRLESLNLLAETLRQAATHDAPTMIIVNDKLFD